MRDVPLAASGVGETRAVLIEDLEGLALELIEAGS